MWEVAWSGVAACKPSLLFVLLCADGKPTGHESLLTKKDCGNKTALDWARISQQNQVAHFLEQVRTPFKLSSPSPRVQKRLESYLFQYAGQIV